MKRLALSLTLAMLAAPSLAAAQQVSPPAPVRIGPAPVPDEAATARYVADFARLCLDPAGERAAVRAAVAQAGWVAVDLTDWPQGEAVDHAHWQDPTSSARLLTSASRAGDMEGGLVVRTCILQPVDGSAGPAARVAGALADRLGWPGTPNGAGETWMASGSAQAGWRDELPAFIGAGSVEAGFALALERPILMLTQVGTGDESALALLRVSPE